MPRLLDSSSEYVHFQTDCIRRMQSIILEALTYGFILLRK